MVIRKEQPSDVGGIADITKAAFTNHPYSRVTEHFIINALRAADALTLSLVAEMDGTPVGHVAFSPVTFTDGTEHWYGLGPVSVLPAYQKQGIGTHLINKGLEGLKDVGARGCVVVGEPAFYTRFGFQNPDQLKHERVPRENLLALSFCNEMPAGIVAFHRAFGATE